MSLIGWEVFWIVTICFHQTSAQDYCASSTLPNVSGVQPLKCKLGVNQRQCVNWRIPVAVDFRNTDLDTIQNMVYNTNAFMRQTSYYCDSNSYTQLYYPGPFFENKCPSFYSIGDNVYWNLTQRASATSKIVLNDVDEDSPGYVLYTLLNKMKECLLQTPLSSNQGGAAFVFTDVTYNQMCGNSFFANSINEMITTLINMKYSVVFQLFSKNVTDSDLASFQNLFSACSKLNDCYLFLNSYTDDWSYDGVWFETCPQYGMDVPAGVIIYEVSLLVVCCVLCGTLYCVYFYKTAKFMKRLKEQLNKNFHKVVRYQGDRAATVPDTDISDGWEINLTDILLKDSEILGNGAFGTVYKAIIAQGKVPLLEKQGHLVMPLPCLPDGTYEAALKRLPEHSTNKNNTDLRNEIQFMKELGYHPHVISMLGCVNLNDTPMLVLEYCEHKDLLNFLRKHRDTFTDPKEEKEPEEIDLEMYYQPSTPVGNSGDSSIPIVIQPKTLLSISWQVCDGMTYLVSKNIIHRDLAARNVLLNSRLVAKIGDFGMCRRANEEFYTSKGGRLPVRWMAPESLKMFLFSTKTDVWSYGVVLYELFSLGLTPYLTVDPEFMCDYLEEGLRLPKVDKCPDEIYEIMQKCWELDPEERPCFNKIRLTLATFLNESDANYNYVDLANPPMSLSSSP